MSTHVFLDTNVLLHFPAFDGLDWPALSGSQKVVLHIPQKVIEEINKHKDAGKNASIRQKAQSIQARLLGFLEQPKLKDGVEVVLETTSPRIEEFPTLNKDVPDDHIIAAALQFRRENPSLDIAVGTDDGGLGLIVKCRKEWNLTVLLVPRDQRYPETVDPLEAENRALKLKVAQMQDRAPVLQLSFSDGAPRLEVVVLPEIAKAHFLAMTMAEHLKGLKPLQVLTVNEKAARPANRQPSREEIFKSIHGPDPRQHLEAQRAKQFNKALTQYESQLPAACEKYWTLFRTSFSFAATVKNVGKGVAHGLCVTLTFPPHVTVRSSSKLETFIKSLFPHKPDPDPFPKLRGDLLEGSSNFEDYLEGAVEVSQNEAGDSLISQTFEKLQHGSSAEIKDLWFTCEEGVKSFGISTKITADELQTAVTGQLGVVVKETVRVAHEPSEG